MAFNITKNFIVTNARQVPYVPSAASQILIDKYFGSTTLLLQADTTNTGTIIDSSTSSLSITMGGTGVQGAVSPFADSGGSELFNGSTDYLSVANSSGLDLNSTFTLECWFYRSVTGNMCLFL